MLQKIIVFSKGGFMKTLRLLLLVAVMFCFMVILSFAQDIYSHGACRADIEKFCKDIKPGHGQISQCMKQHEAELSPACEDHINAEKERGRDFIKDCKPDVGKFCKGVMPGKGRLYRCLISNEARLSPDCKAHFEN
jgi:hypothetical protein